MAAKWGFANSTQPRAALANCDFKCVAVHNSHVWSPVARQRRAPPADEEDLTVQKTNFGRPVNAVYFLDENTGWLVANPGAISRDDGRLQDVEAPAGRRAAGRHAFLHAHEADAAER